MRAAVVVVAVVTAALAGCDGDGDRTEALCGAICDCGSPLPSVHDACMSECVSELPPLPDACVDCVLAASCSQLFDVCDAVCSSPEDS